jgi:hypothetical protein
MGFTESGQPDPEFKAWFAGPWKQLTEAVEVPGMRYASWDRKAAYICWRLAHTEFDLDDVAALLRYIETGNVNTPSPSEADVQRWNALHQLEPIPAEVVAATVGKMTPEAKQGWLAGDFVNLDEDAACPDFPEGVVSGFDSAKW